jgi:predicted nucleic acid-binding protein
MRGFQLSNSDILIDASRGETAAIDFLIQSGRQETLSISVISYMEMLVGTRNRAELRRVEKFLNRFVLLTISEAISLKAIELMREYR